MREDRRRKADRNSKKKECGTVPNQDVDITLSLETDIPITTTALQPQSLPEARKRDLKESRCNGPQQTRGSETFPSQTTHTKTAGLTAGKSCVIPNTSKWHPKLLTEFKPTGLLKLRGE